MINEGKAAEVAMAEGADWHFAVGELNKAQLMALSAAERVMREKAELEAESMRSKVCCFLLMQPALFLAQFQHQWRLKDPLSVIPSLPP